ncbi:hypothetical protein TpMuguga_02g00586 [Theileria parva strain Muguga]|uniref:Uncharacterized protein n=1 Tax=Theileria parva TaxID=5875 RepID=Q4N4Q4_THEPA|nr:uncharacterized protein TpMuguga_02g00586 [Theileria parva strain Muguga]EAN32869.1 hypothetical protein TpMuguga_02g00586 [Theileria parva strain Muguga]|eukprot:XP_765152.1 hypothetical protein [Theileria parva strain Muguga]
MANIFDEVRIVFRGPCERLFIAYKPVGWHVCSPSQKKFTESLSTVIGARLGIPEDSIKFPSKLKINQNGLVIGTTDEPMYNQIRNIIQNKLCTKSYTCIIDKSTIFNPFNGREQLELVGEIRFRLKLLEKKSQFGPNTQVFDISVTVLGSDPISTEETDLKTLKFKLSALENDINWSKINPNAYYLLELQTTDPVVDKNLEEILDQLGIQIKSNPNQSNKEFNLLLNGIQLPHPILRDRKITTQINFPLEH